MLSFIRTATATTTTGLGMRHASFRFIGTQVRIDTQTLLRYCRGQGLNKSDHAPSSHSDPSFIWIVWLRIQLLQHLIAFIHMEKRC